MIISNVMWFMHFGFFCFFALPGISFLIHFWLADMIRGILSWSGPFFLLTIQTAGLQTLDHCFLVKMAFFFFFLYYQCLRTSYISLFNRQWIVRVCCSPGRLICIFPHFCAFLSYQHIQWAKGLLLLLWYTFVFLL